MCWRVFIALESATLELTPKIVLAGNSKLWTSLINLSLNQLKKLLRSTILIAALNTRLEFIKSLKFGYMTIMKNLKSYIESKLPIYHYYLEIQSLSYMKVTFLVLGNNCKC